MTWQAIAIWGQFCIILFTCIVLVAWQWKQSLVMQKIEAENLAKLAQLERIERLAYKLESEQIEQFAKLQHTVEQIDVLRAKTVETDQAVHQVIEHVTETDQAIQQVVENQPEDTGGHHPSG